MKVYPEVLSVTFVKKCQVVNIIVNVMSVGKHVYYFMLIRGNFFC